MGTPTKMHGRVIRLLVVALALLGAALACNLDTGSESAPPTNTPLPFDPLLLTPQTTFAPQPTATLAPTLTGQAIDDPNQAAPTLANCAPQSNWPVYTVQAGDTLSQIAERANTTTAQLVTANCLTNAGLIYVGQGLYVPVIPAPPTLAVPTVAPTFTANPGAPVFSGTLTVEPHWILSSGEAVTYSDIGRVNAGDVYDADSVLFYVNDPSGGAPILIGTDRDPYDGAFADYAFPAPGIYVFQAIARNDVAQVTSRTFSIRYNPDFVPDTGQRNLLALAPYSSYSGGWYVVAANSSVTITWADAPAGALRIDFTVTPTGTGTSGGAQTIGSDLNAADGGQITFNTPQYASGILQGSALMPDGSTVTSETINFVTG